MSNVITIDTFAIKQDTHGRFCLNDLHKASGGDPKHRPSIWIANDGTQALVLEIEQGKAENPALVSIRGGKTPGTFCHPKLAVFFARWLDVRFAVWCDLMIDNILNGHIQTSVAVPTVEVLH